MQPITHRLFLAGTLALIAVPVLAFAPAKLQVEGGGSRIDYTIVHKFHTVVGTSKQVEGVAMLQPDGKVMVQVRAPVTSFDSGNSNRDSHMQETIEAGTYRYVSFKGVANVTPPSSYPATIHTEVPGELEFHGHKQQEKVPVDVVFESAARAHVAGKFPISLEKYGVERPSLMFVKIDDACQIAIDLNLTQS